jgi:hypothetical protein
MPEYPPISTRVIGQTEKTLNAILDRQLTGTGLTEAGWLILTLAVTGDPAAGRDAFTRQIADNLKISKDSAAELMAGLIAAGHLRADDDGSAPTATASAARTHARIRGNVMEITQRLWGDLPAQDLAVAGRVLTIITERANAELAAAGMPGTRSS